MPAASEQIGTNKIVQPEVQVVGKASPMDRAKVLVAKAELSSRGQNGMALDLAEFVIPAGLPNKNAIAIGCGDFPEAVPWAILTNGKIHGMDIADDARPTCVEQSAEILYRNGIEDGTITYSAGQVGDARNIEGYNLQGKRYGAAVIRHPYISDDSDLSIYPSINAILISEALEVNGVVLLTFYSAKEREMYMNILQPYFDAGFLTPGITDSEGNILLDPLGLPRLANDRGKLGADFQLFGFRKVRDMTTEEYALIQQKVEAILKDSSSIFSVNMTYINESRKAD